MRNLSASERISVRILEVDKDELIKAIEKLGARKSFDDTVFIDRFTMSSSQGLDTEQAENHLKPKLRPIVDELRATKNVALVLRYDTSAVELSLVSAGGPRESHKMTASFDLSDKEALTEWLAQSGFKRKSHQEVRRLCFVCEQPSVEFLIEEWPAIPAYLEVVSDDSAATLSALKLIGQTEDDVIIGSENDLFRHYSASPTYMSFADREVELSHETIEDLTCAAIKNSAPHLAEIEIMIIADHYIGAEYSGKKTHGLRKLCWDIQFYGDRLGAPQLTRDSPSMALIDGQRELGPLAAIMGVETVIKKAKDTGVAVVAITGAQRFGVLATWTEKIAKAGLIGILTTSTEPFTALPETATGVLGTNPLSIGIPYKDTPIVYDAAFSKAPVNLMWLNRLLGLELPQETFLDDAGHYTNDPFRSKRVEVFGGSKGSGLAMMLQLLSGPLMGVQSHKSFQEPYENAFYFQAIDPAFFQTAEEFEAQINDFVQFAKQAPLREGYDNVRLPGEKSRRNLSEALRAEKIKVHEGIIGWLNFLGSN